MTTGSGDQADDGFTLIELLVVIAVSGFIVAALTSAFLMSMRLLAGLDSSKAVAGAGQDQRTVNAQLDASSSLPALVREVTSDLSNSTESVVRPSATLPAAMSCIRPAQPAGYAIKTVILSTVWTDSAGVDQGVAYEYSKDAAGLNAEINRFVCSPSAPTTLATGQTLVRGLSASQTPVVTPPSATGVVSLTLYSVTGRRYAFDGYTRRYLPAGAPAAVPGSLLTSSVLDTNGDGRLDRLEATFDLPGLPAAACQVSSAWSLSTPTGQSVLGAVVWTGSTARVPLTPGSGPNTSNFGVSFDYTPPAGCTDVGAVGGSVPTDEAPPVLIETTNGAEASSNNGQLDAADAVKLTFSEPLDPVTVPSQVNVVVDDTGGPGGVESLDIRDSAGTQHVFTAPTPTLGDYVRNNKVATWLADAQLDAATGRTLTVTLSSALSACTANPNCSGVLNASLTADVKVVPSSTLKDFEQLSAVASTTPAVLPFRIF